MSNLLTEMKSIIEKWNENEHKQHYKDIVLTDTTLTFVPDFEYDEYDNKVVIEIKDNECFWTSKNNIKDFTFGGESIEEVQTDVEEWLECMHANELDISMEDYDDDF
jgi:predicted RNase H-like HicB family nuclease